MTVTATNPRDRAALAFAAHLRNLLEGCSAHVRMSTRAILDASEPHPTDHIRAFLDLNTCHVTDGDRALLEGGAPGLSMLNRDTGWMVHAGSDREEFERDRVTELLAYGYSKDFINVLRTAIDSGCDYVMFDSDAVEYDGLPMHEW